MRSPGSTRSSRRSRLASIERRERRAARRQKHGRGRLSALWRTRGRALRQDGAQRHRVRPDGGVRGRDEHPSSRQHRQAEPGGECRDDAASKPRALSVPISTSAEIAEVWRRGSVVASWLLDLTAAVAAGTTGPERVLGPRLRFRRGSVDYHGRHRVVDARACPERRALSAFLVAGRSRLRRSPAVGHALSVRRPSRARDRRKISTQRVLNDEGCRDTGSREVRRSVGARGAHERDPCVRGHP